MSEIREAYDHFMSALNSDIESVRIQELGQARRLFAKLAQIDPNGNALYQSDYEEKTLDNKVIICLSELGSIYYFIAHNDIRNAAITAYRYVERYPEFSDAIPKQIIETVEVYQDYVNAITSYELVKDYERVVSTSSDNVPEIMIPLVRAKRVQEEWWKKLEERYIRYIDRKPWYKRVVSNGKSKKLLEDRISRWGGEYSSNRKREKESNIIRTLYEKKEQEIIRRKDEAEKFTEALKSECHRLASELEKVSLKDILNSQSRRHAFQLVHVLNG